MSTQTQWTSLWLPPGAVVGCISTNTAAKWQGTTPSKVTRQHSQEHKRSHRKANPGRHGRVSAGAGAGGRTRPHIHAFGLAGLDNVWSQVVVEQASWKQTLQELAWEALAHTRMRTDPHLSGCSCCP